MKAVIVDLQDNKAAVLCDKGAVLEIPDQGYCIGQTIDLPEDLIREEEAPVSEAENRPSRSARGNRRMLTGIRKIAAAAAACFLVVCLGAGTAWAMPIGSVHVESGSSLAYTINCFDYVLEVDADNEAGEELLQSLDLKKIVNRKIDRALEETLEQMDRKAAGEKTSSEDPAITSAAEPVEIRTEIKNRKHAGALQERLGKILDSAKREPDSSGPAGQEKSDSAKPAGENPSSETPDGLSPSADPGSGPESDGRETAGKFVPGPGSDAQETGGNPVPGSASDARQTVGKTGTGTVSNANEKTEKTETGLNPAGEEESRNPVGSASAGSGTEKQTRKQIPQSADDSVDQASGIPSVPGSGTMAPDPGQTAPGAAPAENTGPAGGGAPAEDAAADSGNPNSTREGGQERESNDREPEAGERGGDRVGGEGPGAGPGGGRS